jgi:hypothetical protein
MLGLLRPYRRVLPLVATAAYVGVAAIAASDGRGLRPWACAVAATVLAWRAARHAEPFLRAALWGLAVALASAGAHEDDSRLQVLGAVGAMVAVLAASFAIPRVHSVPCLARPRGRPRAPEAAAVAAMWLLAIWARLRAVAGDESWLAEHPRALAEAAAVVSYGALLWGTAWTLRRRRLELEVAVRAHAMTTLTVTLGVLALGASFVASEPAQVGRVGVGLLGALLVRAARLGDPVRFARATRRVVVLALAGGAILMMAASFADYNPPRAALATLLSGAIMLGIGAAAGLLEEPLRPERGAWLDAFDKARAVLLRLPPDEAVRELLLSVRLPAGPAAAPPELWTFPPTHLATVDAAGYLRERDAELVDGVVAIASAEPDAVLRSEVLDALVVRRPDLRPLARWMDDRGAFAAVVVTRAGEPEGLLVLPRGRREEMLTLEETRALKELADALAGVCHARSVEERARERERAAFLRADAAEEAAERLRHDLSLDAGRQALATARLARPATVGVYSAASRLALEAIERRTLGQAPLAVVAPSGVDPVPYLARAHLSGPRRREPFVLVDGTSAREHDLARWSAQDASPLALADRGMLVLCDGAALPLDVQALVARALAERRPPWERPQPLDIVLALTTTEPPARLIEAGRLDGALATRLADALDAPVVLPGLRDRPEDMRAILTDRLAREGMRTRGTPVGIEAAAYARLIEYGFPGEDAELAAIVQRLVRSAEGEVVRVADVEGLGLRIEEEKEPEGERRRPRLA